MIKKSVVSCFVWFFLNILLSPTIYAQECSPLQLSLYSAVQLVQKDKIVCGLRLDLPQGNNVEVWGVDAGLVNIAGAVKGFQIGGVNLLKHRDESASWGIQTGLVNYGGKLNGIQGGFLNSSSVNGIQLGLFNGYRNPIDSEDDTNGVQLAFSNVSRAMNGVQIGFLGNGAVHVRGLQIGLLGNGAADEISGIQVGLINTSEHVMGIQVGVLNLCKYLTGVQIGFINIVHSGSNAMPFLPIINVGWY
jgi:hypothetical protein